MDTLHVLACAQRRTRVISDRKKALEGELVTMCAGIKRLERAASFADVSDLIQTFGDVGLRVPDTGESLSACMARSAAAADAGAYVLAEVLKPLPNASVECEPGEVVEMLANEFAWLKERGFCVEADPLPEVDNTLARRVRAIERALAA